MLKRTLLNFKLATGILLLSGSFANAQNIQAIQDVKLKVVYEEVRENTFKTEDLSLIKDYQKINLLNQKKTLQVTQLESFNGQAQVRLLYLDDDDGIWPEDQKEIVFDPNQAPGIVSNASNSTSISSSRTPAKSSKTGRGTSRGQLGSDFIQKNQFPVLMQEHINQLEGSRIPFHIDRQGTALIHFTPNHTIEINPVLKTVMEIIRINTAGQVKTVIKTTSYTEIVCPDYVNPEGDPIYTTSKPLWFPTQIIITEDEQITGGTCIQKINRISRDVKTIEGVGSNLPS